MKATKIFSVRSSPDPSI